MPAGLRAGGATHLFLHTQDVALVKWRGRWTSDRTLEHYLQEMGAAGMLAELTEATRLTIAEYASQTKPLLELITSSTRTWPDRLLTSSSQQKKTNGEL